MRTEQELLKLLQAIIDISESTKGTISIKDSRFIYAEGLLLKLFNHISTAFYISRATTIPEIRVSYFDSASINILTRAAIETFLTFQFVFVDSENDEEKDFRFWVWALAGYLDRQRLGAISSYGKNILHKEKVDIEALQENIKNCSIYKKLINKQQQQLLNDAKWRWFVTEEGNLKHKSWSEIGLSAGLAPCNAKRFYDYLCGYAHASYLSVGQVMQAYTVQDQKTIFAPSFGMLLILSAFMIKSYTTIFPQGINIINSDPKLKELYDLQIYLGSTSIDDINLDYVK